MNLEKITEEVKELFRKHGLTKKEANKVINELSMQSKYDQMAFEAESLKEWKNRKY